MSASRHADRHPDLLSDLGSRVRGTRFWHRATTRARDYLDGGRDLGTLLRRVSARLDTAPLVGELVDDTRTMVRLVRAYAAGHYRDVAVDDLLLIVAGLVYFVNPIDLVPDLVAGVGLVDDIVVLGFVVRSVPDVLGRFRAWEQRRAASPDGDAPGLADDGAPTT